jgi:simple sugar transport system permease protein
MNIKSKLKFQLSTFQYSSNRRKGLKSLLVSILAILSAIIISLLITVIIYHDFSKFGGVLKQIFLAPFQDSAHANYTISTIAIFGVAALSFLYAFRAGLFNIGISGQMLFAGIIAVIIGQHIGNSLPTGIGQIIMLLICILSGMLIAGIIGVLKAFLNLNEVVSSITFN